MERIHELRKKLKDLDEKEAQIKTRIQSKKNSQVTRHSGNFNKTSTKLRSVPPPLDNDLPTYNEITESLSQTPFHSKEPILENGSDFYEGDDYSTPKDDI